MEAKVSEVPTTKLPDLPPSSDGDFWLEAEIHTGIVPEAVNQGGTHYFERISGHQAYCKHCNWGFQLDSGDKIVDGHLFDKKGKLVI